MTCLERTGLRPRALTALFTAALALSAAPAPAADKGDADALKSLKGTWVAYDPVDASWTFEGETLKATVNGLDYTCKVKADPKAKPATLDIMIDDGPEEAKGKTSKAIYKMDGETLVLCVSLPGKDRPKEFETNEGETYVFELKKEKAKEKEKDKDKEKVEKKKPEDV